MVGVTADNSASGPDRDAVLTALKSLQPTHRHLIRRAYYEGSTTHQLAAELNIPEVVVKSELHCALRNMRKLMG
ncbi:sigma factor-like helix-turn-helix DNA-binding protein [Mycobacterium sp. BMJ-28]